MDVDLPGFFLAALFPVDCSVDNGDLLAKKICK